MNNDSTSKFVRSIGNGGKRLGARGSGKMPASSYPLPTTHSFPLEKNLELLNEKVASIVKDPGGDFLSALSPDLSLPLTPPL
jgi:hypothetical protein